MVACVAMGIIIGLLAGANLCILLICVLRRLSTKTSYPRHELLSILGLAAFLGGGTWSSYTFIPQDQIREYVGLYLAGVSILMVALSAYPLVLLSLLAGKIASGR